MQIHTCIISSVNKCITNLQAPGRQGPDCLISNTASVETAVRNRIKSSMCAWQGLRFADRLTKQEKTVRENLDDLPSFSVSKCWAWLLVHYLKYFTQWDRVLGARSLGLHAYLKIIATPLSIYCGTQHYSTFTWSHLFSPPNNSLRWGTTIILTPQVWGLSLEKIKGLARCHLA